jgi:hypothetical protein
LQGWGFTGTGAKCDSYFLSFSCANTHRSAFLLCLHYQHFPGQLAGSVELLWGGLTVTSVVYALVHRRITNWGLLAIFGSNDGIWVAPAGGLADQSAANMDGTGFDLGLRLPAVTYLLAATCLPARYLRWLWLCSHCNDGAGRAGCHSQLPVALPGSQWLYLHKGDATEPEHIRFSLNWYVIAAGILLLAHHAVKPVWEVGN